MAVQAALIPILTSVLGSLLGGGSGSNKGGTPTSGTPASESGAGRMGRPTQAGVAASNAATPGGIGGGGGGGGIHGTISGLLGGVGDLSDSGPFARTLDARRRYKEAQYFMLPGGVPQINWPGPQPGLGGAMLGRILGMEF